PELARLLADWIAETTDRHPRTYLFPRAIDRAMTERALESRCEKWGKLANEEHCHPHRFRHDYGTRLLECGADVRLLQQRMGHESLATTAGYLGVVDKQLQDVVKLLSDQP